MLWKLKLRKLEVDKLVNIPTSLNNLQTKVDDFDVDNLKTIPVDLNKLSNIVDNEVDRKIPDATTLIHIN